MNYDINTIMETYQDMVDNNIISLEEGQELFDENLNDYLIELKNDIDNAYAENIITAYEKDICYINIGLDTENDYMSVITNMIESELNPVNESNDIIEEKSNVPSKEEYYRKQLEKQAKKEKRKQLFKNVGKVAAGAALIGGAAYAANKIDKANNDKGVVRADNPEYAHFFKTREDSLNKLEQDYQAKMKRAKSDIEKADLTDKYKADVANVNNEFKQGIFDHKSNKRAAYDEKRRRDTAAYNRAVANTNDPKKLAEYKKQHEEVMNKYDLDKENKAKMDQYNRSDYYRKQELNREDPNNLKGLGKLFFKKSKERKQEKINKKYDEYNRNNIQ